MGIRYLKPYEEYVKLFKELCDKLIDNPNKEDLKINNLPSQKWFVENNPEPNVNNYYDFVKLVFNPNIPVDIPIKKYEKIIGENWKPTKTYHEYILIYKFIYNELKRLITPSELERHDYGLPSVKWLIKYSRENIKTYNDFLDSLEFDPIKKRKKHRKYTFEIAFEEFAKRGLYLPPQEYTSCAIPLKYICPKHPDIIQIKSLNSLLFNLHGSGNGCNICCKENQFGAGSYLWKGGISSLNIYLREFIDDWKKESIKNCNYKCVITGDKFNDIHHLYSFNKIFKEVMDESNLPIYTEINKYSEEKIELIKTINIKIHKKYHLGICLRKDIHDLYHKIYGDDNTPEQFEEFKVRYDNGEFNETKKIYNKAKSNTPYKTVQRSNKLKMKINPNQFSEIRTKYKSGNYLQKQLASEYNVCRSVISDIINFKGIYNTI